MCPEVGKPTKLQWKLYWKTIPQLGCDWNFRATREKVGPSLKMDNCPQKKGLAVPKRFTHWRRNARNLNPRRPNDHSLNQIEVRMGWNLNEANVGITKVWMTTVWISQTEVRMRLDSEIDWSPNRTASLNQDWSPIGSEVPIPFVQIGLKIKFLVSEQKIQMGLGPNFFCLNGTEAWIFLLSQWDRVRTLVAPLLWVKGTVQRD